MGFNSFEEMQDHLAKMSEAARAGLHPAQQALTFGSTWVQFVDIAERHVVFGYVSTLDQVEQAELRSGANVVAARDARRETEVNLDEGDLLYGRAYDRFNVGGELGHTHRANAWPIDAGMFQRAADVRWDMDALETPDKINLQAAFTAFRTHKASIR
jgi:hypothetical protein